MYLVWSKLASPLNWVHKTPSLLHSFFPLAYTRTHTHIHGMENSHSLNEYSIFLWLEEEAKGSTVKPSSWNRNRPSGLLLCFAKLSLLHEIVCDIVTESQSNSSTKRCLVGCWLLDTMNHCIIVLMMLESRVCRPVEVCCV